MQSKLAMASRYLLGLIFFVSGLNGFLQFLPAPPMPEGVMAFFKGVMVAPYFIPLLKTTELICGALLLSGFASPLALVILAPITIQIFFFHAFLTPGLENIVLPVVMITLHALAASAYWHLYRPLFARNPAR